MEKTNFEKMEKLNKILDELVDVNFFGDFYNTSTETFELWTSDGMDDCYVKMPNGNAIYNEYELSCVLDELGYTNDNMVIMGNMECDTVYIYNVEYMECIAFFIGDDEKIDMRIWDIDDMVDVPFQNFATFVNLIKKINEI